VQRAGSAYKKKLSSNSEQLPVIDARHSRRKLAPGNGLMGLKQGRYLSAVRHFQALRYSQKANPSTQDRLRGELLNWVLKS
jgi:hypothetical protein